MNSKDKQVGNIYKTKDLEQFKECTFNRDIDLKHVDKIYKSMKEFGYIGSPITITKDGTLIDGHHRVLAARKAGISVEYRIDNTSMSLVDKIVKSNESVKSWGKVDYIKSNVAKGLQSYIDLKKFQRLFPEFTLTEQLMMLNNGINVDKDIFASGEWKCKNFKEGSEWAVKILKIKKLFPRGYNKSNFVRVMIDTFKNEEVNFDMDEFVRKVELRRDSIYVCGNKEDYRRMIERIYNFKRNRNELINLG